MKRAASLGKESLRKESLRKESLRKSSLRKSSLRKGGSRAGILPHVRPAVWGGLAGILAAAFVLELSLGSVLMPVKTVAAILAGNGDVPEGLRQIVLLFRLPRAVTAVLAGSALSVSGLQMQTLFRNPLADPFVLGISSGAGLGVALVVMTAGGLGAGFLPEKGAPRLSLVLTQRIDVGMMQVATLVSLGRHPYTDWTGRLRPEDEEAVGRAIADVGIEPLANRPVSELSDGERQKASIARALAQEPEIMILDEATAYLDLPRRVELMHLLGRLAHSGNRAILLSTHDLDLALRCADRLWLLPTGGPLLSGVPEDRVLSDAFGRTFAEAGVRFDKGSGAFTLKNAPRGAVALRGSGVPGMWTRRALDRAGYCVVPEGEARGVR